MLMNVISGKLPHKKKVINLSIDDFPILSVLFKAVRLNDKHRFCRLSL